MPQISQAACNLGGSTRIVVEKLGNDGSSHSERIHSGWPR
jgi:hypothetical protein